MAALVVYALVPGAVAGQEVEPETVPIRISNERTVPGRVFLECQRLARPVGIFFEEGVTTVELPIVMLCQRGSLIFQFESGSYVVFDAGRLRKLELGGKLAGVLVCLRAGSRHELQARDTSEVPWHCPES